MPDIVTGSMSGIVYFLEMGGRRASSQLFRRHDQTSQASAGVAPEYDFYEVQLIISKL